MQIIPLLPVPAQTQRTLLNNQDVTLTVYERRAYAGKTPYPAVYIDVAISGVAILTGCLARNRVRCIRDSHLGLVGDLAFVDLLGSLDPVSSGFGTRWVLVYLEYELEGYVPPVIPPDMGLAAVDFNPADFGGDFLSGNS